MNFSILSAPAFLLVFLPSCVSYTSVKDEPRQTVRFATPRAAQIFYDAYRGPSEQRSIAVGIGLPYKHRVITSDNASFNSGVAQADSNHNGVITEKEAVAFASSSTATARNDENPF